MFCKLGWHVVPQRQFGWYKPDAYNAGVWLYGSSKLTRSVISFCIFCDKGRVR